MYERTANGFEDCSNAKTSVWRKINFTIAKVHSGGTYTLKGATDENLDRRQTISMLKIAEPVSKSLQNSSGAKDQNPKK